jgi:biotin transport system substrate-specific component
MEVEKMRSRDTSSLTLAALFTALMIAGAYISLPTPAVPITFQPFFSILAGSILGPRLGLLSMLAYIALGLAGVPVFAGFSGGIAKVLSPTFGFIMGFAAAAVVTGIVMGGRKPTYTRVTMASFAGMAVIYMLGIPYFYLVLKMVSGKDTTFLATMITLAPFLLKDMVLALVASAIAIRLIPVASKAIKS